MLTFDFPLHWIYYFLTSLYLLQWTYIHLGTNVIYFGQLPIFINFIFLCIVVFFILKLFLSLFVLLLSKVYKIVTCFIYLFQVHLFFINIPKYFKITLTNWYNSRNYKVVQNLQFKFIHVEKIYFYLRNSDIFIFCGENRGALKI